MPSTGVNTDDQSYDQKEFNKLFTFEFTKLIKNDLLNFDEMQTKTSKDSSDHLKPEQLLSLFSQTVNQLNENQTNRNEEQTQTENQFLEEDQRIRTLSKTSTESIEVIGCPEQNSSEYMYQPLQQSSDELNETSNIIVLSDDSFNLSFEFVGSPATSETV